MPCIFLATKDALCIDLCTFLFFFCKIQEIVIEEIAFRNLYAHRTCSKKHVQNSQSRQSFTNCCWHKLWPVVHLCVQYKFRKNAHVQATFVMRQFLFPSCFSGQNFYFQKLPLNGCKSFLFHHFTGLIFMASGGGANVLWNCVGLLHLECLYFLQNFFSISISRQKFYFKHRFNTLQCSSACVS